MDPGEGPDIPLDDDHSTPHEGARLQSCISANDDAAACHPLAAAPVGGPGLVSAVLAYPEEAALHLGAGPVPGVLLDDELAP